MLGAWQHEDKSCFHAAHSLCYLSWLDKCGMVRLPVLHKGLGRPTSMQALDFPPGLPTLGWEKLETQFWGKKFCVLRQKFACLGQQKFWLCQVFCFGVKSSGKNRIPENWGKCVTRAWDEWGWDKHVILTPNAWELAGLFSPIFRWRVFNQALSPCK